MNVTLTDHLVCPRCGPPFGLILLAHKVRDRRVQRGEFGCANCRDRFPVEDGFGDLRPPPRGESMREEGLGGEGGAAVAGAPGDAGGAAGGGGAPAGAGGGDAATRALRLAAGLGVAEGPGMIVVPDSNRDEAAAIARLVRGIEVVVVGWGGRGLAADGVSAFVTGPRLPLRDGVVRGVVAEGGGGAGWWGECLRVLMPGGRVVVTEATAAARDWVQGAGLTRVLDESGLLVAAFALPGAAPRMGRWIGEAKKPRP